MIHPNTELRTVSPEIGVGVFATTLIPKGTIIYVEDPLEIVIPPDHEMFNSPAFRNVIDTYAVINADGSYEISWDYAKYVNHCCHYNTICTSFGVDVAIRDIQPGEQILEDYGMFNVNYPMTLKCSYEDCRRQVTNHDYDWCSKQWDRDARDALLQARLVAQPLWDVIFPENQKKLKHFFETGEGYLSVTALRFEKKP